MTNPGDLFRTAVAAVEPIVGHPCGPDAETPCPDWTYDRLLAHLVGGDRLFHALLTGATSRPSSDSGAAPGTGSPSPRPRGVADPRPPVPTPAGYREAAGRLADDLAAPEVAAGVFDVPAGRLTGPQVELLRSVEHVLHGWDLAKAAGAPTVTLEPVAEALSEPATRLLAAVVENAPPGRRPFAPPVAVGPDAGPLDRFVAAFGRDPSWLPDPIAGTARLHEQFVGRDDVALPDGTRRGYGAAGLRAGDRMFACPYQGRLLLTLPADEVSALVAARQGVPLAKPGQRPMREWVQVPFDAAAAERAERACSFVRAKR